MDTWRLPVVARAACLAAMLVLGALLQQSRESRAAPPEGASSRVIAVHVDGVINPLTVQYLDRAIDRAEATGVEAVVLQLDTPGGLESSMRAVVQRMLASSVPVIVHVAPPGARAASAGMFLTLAAHVAAMAPGTNIGSAHPVSHGGHADPVLAEKMTSDAAAFARALAETRGRNADWAERAVRESVSITAEEALQQGVIDMVIAEPEALLDRADGRSVTTAGSVARLDTRGAAMVTMKMTLPERILHTVADPNIAFLLLGIASLGLTLELLHPGAIVPGVVGITALLVALAALGTLPTNWAGIALIALAVALVVADAFAAGLGLLAVGGLAMFVVGGLLLFSPWEPVSPAMPDVRLDPVLLTITAGVVATMVALVGRAAARAQRAPVRTGTQALIGRSGVAVTDLAPRGMVRVEGETWTAVADVGVVQAGREIQVLRVEGVTLHVIAS
jgi:membrane-bound serine protease (ClpP class)